MLTILGPGAPSYIPPAALAASPPRGSQVTTVTRMENNTTVIQRPDGTINTISSSGSITTTITGASRVQIGSGNV